MENKKRKTVINPLLQNAGEHFPEMLANLMHNLPGMAYRCLYDDSWTMLFLSEGSTYITGYPASEILYNEVVSYDNLIYEDDREYVRRCVDEAVQKRTQFQMEYRIIDSQGEIRWVWEKGAAVYDAANKPIWLDGFISDVTARKRMEEELKSVASNLVELNATKDKFFSLLAHDLQNPVYAIISLSEFLSSNYSSFTEIEMLGFVNQINVSAQSLYTLLENLLDWAKTQTDKVTVLKEPLSVNKVVNVVVEHFKPVLSEKMINIVLHEEQEFIVESDSRLLHSIIRNLMSNAIKYSYPNSQIKIILAAEKERLKLSVSDRGTGIPRRYLERIFRIDNDYKMPGTNHEGGSGLGLLLVKNFVENLGGEITLSSKLNYGSTFNVFLKLLETARSD